MPPESSHYRAAIRSASIFIPCYNQAKYLQASIGSALKQTDAAEIIISDDKSTDASVQILESMALSDTRLHVILQPRNLGIPANIDAGMRATRADFILRLDSDDRLLDGACATLSAALDSHPEAGAAHGKVWEIDEAGQRTRARVLRRAPGYQAPRQALLDAADGYRVAANIIMFRREALAAVNYLQNRPSFAEDYHLFADLAAHGWGNVYVDSFVAEYRNYTNPIRAARKAQEIRGLTAVFAEVLEPAYRAAGLPSQRLQRGRRRLAAAQARFLLEADLSPVQQAETIVLLDVLHVTPWPRIYSQARQLGLAQAFTAVHQARHAVRQFAKNVYTGTRHALGR